MHRWGLASWTQDFKGKIANSAQKITCFEINLRKSMLRNGPKKIDDTWFFVLILHYLHIYIRYSVGHFLQNILQSQQNRILQGMVNYRENLSFDCYIYKYVDSTLKGQIIIPFTLTSPQLCLDSECDHKIWFCHTL